MCVLWKPGSTWRDLKSSKRLNCSFCSAQFKIWASELALPLTHTFYLNKNIVCWGWNEGWFKQGALASLRTGAWKDYRCFNNNLFKEESCLLNAKYETVLAWDGIDCRTHLPPLKRYTENCGFHVNAGTEQISKSMVRQLHHVSPSTSASGWLDIRFRSMANNPYWILFTAPPHFFPVESQ